MKRFPGEPFEEYRVRRKGESVITKAHLAGRFSDGRYADPALDKTMEKTVSRENFKRRSWVVVNLCFAAAVGYLVGTLLYAII